MNESRVSELSDSLPTPAAELHGGQPDGPAADTSPAASPGTGAVSGGEQGCRGCKGVSFQPLEKNTRNDISYKGWEHTQNTPDIPPRPFVLCYPGLKMPIGDDWQHRTLSAEEVRAELAEYPHYNVGIVLGPATGIDVETDSEEAAQRFAELFQDVRTPSWRAKKGAHSLFRYDARLADLPAVVVMFGIEFRLGNGKAAQSICPPSIVDGVRREWIVKPEDCPLAALPETVVALLLQQPKRKPRLPATDLPESRNAAVARLQRYCARNGLAIKGDRTWQGNTVILLGNCPFKSPDNEKGDPAFIVFPDGSVVFKCLHQGCLDKTLADVEAIYGPLWPTIQISTNLQRNVNQAIAALSDDPAIFQRGGILVEPVSDPPKPAQCLIGDGTPRLVEAHPARLTAKLSDLAHFEKWSDKKGKWIPSLPSPPIVNAVAASPVYPGIPSVMGMASAPILRQDGTIVTKAGYDPGTGVYLTLDGEYPPLMKPSEAIALLCDILFDFPFLADAHKSAWEAALITGLARTAFAGCSPLFLFDANTPRTGKGLLTDLLAIIWGGDQAARQTPPKEAEEWRKTITTVALSGAPYFLLDNVKGKLGGPAIEAVLTTTRWGDRKLGGNEQVSLPITFILLATANNATLTSDMTGRTCLCRLESAVEHPELRNEFKHRDLIGYVRQRRRELAIAALSIPAGYIKANCPDQHLPAWGGFEGWSDLVRNSIVWAGLPDCDTRETLAEMADDETDTLRRLMDGWQELGDGAHTVAEAVERIDQGKAETLKQLLAEIPGDRSRTLGTLLRDWRRRVLGGRKFDKPNRKVSKWQLMTVAP